MLINGVQCTELCVVDARKESHKFYFFLLLYVVCNTYLLSSKKHKETLKDMQRNIQTHAKEHK